MYFNLTFWPEDGVRDTSIVFTCEVSSENIQEFIDSIDYKIYCLKESKYKVIWNFSDSANVTGESVF
jgi:hypothetical protein